MATFKSNETIWGCTRQGNDLIQYRGMLTVAKSGQVSLELRFVPPHPFLVNMPEHRCIEARSITEAYARLVEFLNEFGVDLIH